MATSISQHAEPQSAGTTPEFAADRLIEQQLRKARRQLKLIDLVSSLIVLAVGILTYFLLVTLLDHWLLPLGTAGRWLSLVALLAGVAGYVVLIVVPLLTRRINPLFAARSIEQNQPTLKNSLVNFLFLRGDRRAVHQAIYDALRDRAATDLSAVEVESVVDYRPIIRLGVVLAGIFAAAALYLMLSPKDPLQTVRRVTAPWAEIARPTKVQIDDVQPGDTDVFHGQTQRIRARVRGAAEGDLVQVVFSTEDEQIVDRVVPMQPAADGLYWEATLPADEQGATDAGGLQQDLRYHVAAGDAVSATYRLHVLPAPTMIVKRVEYDFPDYTGREDAVEQGRGDIRALEGTRVTIHAEANQPIGQAYIEFDPHQPADAKSDGGTEQRATLSMKADGRTAWRTFVLRLDRDRKTPVYDTYQVRFRTADGHASQYPVVHDIQVLPDLSPEVAILTPGTSPVEVPEDGTQRIEVRAMDPVFGLREIRLRAVAGGTQVLDQILFEDPQGRVGQTVANYEFRPRQLGLTAGDRVSYWALAEDNRREPGGSDLQPNVQRTRNMQLIIVAPERGDQEGSPRPGEKKEPPDAADDPGQSGEQGTGEQGGEQGEQGGDQGQEGSPQGGEGQQPGEQGEPGEKGDPKAEGQPQPGQGQPGADSAESQQGGDAGQAGQQDAKPDPAAQGESGDTPSGGKGQGTPRGDQQAGQPSDASGGEQGTGQGTAEQPRQGGSAPSGEGTREEPLHDGEVIEKINELIERRKEEQQGEAQESPAADGGSSSSSKESAREAGEAADAGQPAGTEQGTAQDARQGTKPSPDAQPTPPNDGTSPAGQPPSGQDQGETRAGDAGAGEQRGEGGRPEGDRRRPEEPRDEKSETPAGAEEREGGLGDNGQSGAGQEAQDSGGAAGKQGENRDRSKSPDSGEETPGKPEEGESPSISKRQSDSEGAQSGDRSGGGKQGPGQSANQQGNDSAGSNSPADSGAGAADESGAGETADRAGDDRQADQPTGRPGEAPGAGSSSRPSESGDQSQPDPGDRAGGEAAGREAQDSRQNETPSSPRSGSPSGPTQGGGLPGGGGEAPADLGDEVPDGQDANLEYARKATDLALEYLEQQQDRPDSKLLDELGWSQDDLRQFLDRWKRLQQNAQSGDARQQAEWEKALQSLGLRPQQPQIRRAAGSDDAVRGLRESGVRSEPPSAYRELFEAYQKSTSRRSSD